MADNIQSPDSQNVIGQNSAKVQILNLKDVNSLASLKTLDQSFAASLLSQAVYTDNLWTMEKMGSKFEDMGTHIRKSIDSQQEMARLKLWNYLNENYRPVLNSEVNLSSIGAEEIHRYKQEKYNFTTEYTFQNGQYSAGSKYKDIAHAALLTSEDPENPGKKILHVSFRGTEFNRIKEFIPHAYMDMDAYYHHFKPLESMIKAYVSNPANNISQIHASGHSLGGAMAEEFLKRMPDDPEAGYIVKGFTFGSPGSTKKPLLKFLTTAYHALKKNIIPDHSINQSPLNQENKEIDSRLVNFYHSNDPVPKLGIAGYTKSGRKIVLHDNMEIMSQKVGFTKKSFLEKWPLIGRIATFFDSKRYHDSDRYSINLRDQIEGRIRHAKAEDISGPNAHFSNEWKKFAKSEIHFQSLGIKYKGAIESIIAHNEPGISYEGLQKKLYEVRDQMKHHNAVQIAMNKFGNTKGTDHLTVMTDEKNPAVIKNLMDGEFGNSNGMTPAERMNRLAKLRERIDATHTLRQFKV